VREYVSVCMRVCLCVYVCERESESVSASANLSERVGTCVYEIVGCVCALFNMCCSLVQCEQVRACC